MYPNCHQSFLDMNTYLGTRKHNILVVQVKEFEYFRSCLICVLKVLWHLK